jgi:hypothetical protein
MSSHDTVSRWKRWRFHLSALLLILPIAFMPQYFHRVALFSGDLGLGQRVIGEQTVGPWSVRLAEFEERPPELDGGAGYMKTFSLALCDGCESSIRAMYLRVGKPRSLRTAGAIFFGSPYRQTASVPIPDGTTPDAMLWLTAEGWDGSVHHASIPLATASPITAGWLRKRGGR